MQRIRPASQPTRFPCFLRLALPLTGPLLTLMLPPPVSICPCVCCSFGGFGSDLCSGNYEESWRDRSEFVKLAGERARKLCPGVNCIQHTAYGPAHRACMSMMHVVSLLV
jgi:hypothetical protein